MCYLLFLLILRIPLQTTPLSPSFPTRRSSDLAPASPCAPATASYRAWLQQGRDCRHSWWQPASLHAALTGWVMTAPPLSPPRAAPSPSRCGSPVRARSEEHTSELQSLMRISYAVLCLKKKNIYEYTHEL